MLAELVGYLNDRKRSQNQARAIDGGGFSEKEFISRYEMLCIVIDDLKEFVDTVSDNNKNAMERICRMAQDLGVVVLCAGRMTDISKYNEIESLTRVIVGNQNGLVMNGTPAQHSYFQNNLKYTERDAEAGEGLSYLYTGGKCIKVKFMQ
jgi:S-DNA-T family DNA segregation ATPase FtsK/SpoIIIE